MLAILVVNHRTVEATRICLQSLLPELTQSVVVHLLDNDSGGADAQRLEAFAAQFPYPIHFFASSKNLGFAGGMNLLLGRALADPVIDQILLLNSDTRPAPGFIAAMLAKIDTGAHIDMVAAKLLNPRNDEVDSLGISLYRSTLASNRKRADEILLGPSGGCALYTRRLLEDLHAAHGEWFDEDFFCYAEDTDLAVRARWLGYAAGYASEVIIYHEGSLSSGGPDNDFVLYHGIRNSLWWLIKGAPTGWLLRSLPLFILLHCGICLRHLSRGRLRVLWRLYRDAFKGLPKMRRKRAIIRASRRVPAREFSRWVEPHFYERGYVRRAWRELWCPAKTTP